MFEFVKHLFRLQFFFILIAIFVGIYYQQIVERFTFKEKTLLNVVNGGEMLFTKDQLAEFNGEDGAPIYLALLGSVYDVTKGKKHYGVGCTYNHFVGRDASVSFITGEFEHYDETNADDVIALKQSDLLSLWNWKKFYDKDYIYKGKVIGRFYDSTGTPTEYYHKFEALVKQAEEMKASFEELRTVYPDCNIEWSEQTGTRVWCTKSSGGKDRDWEGYPRKLFEVGSDSYRCACIRKEDLNTTAVMIQRYDNCKEFSKECYYSIN